MRNLLKMFGFGAALTACGLALADWYCNRCGRWHNGRKCPTVTLGFACEDNYGCAPYGCFYQDNYACDDDGYDSDDEEDMIRQAIQRRSEHHQRSINNICNSFRHIRTANDFRRVQDALNQRANELGILMNNICNSFRHIQAANDFRRVQDALNQKANELGILMNQPHFGCMDDGYGCQNYGCIDLYNYYGCW